MEVLLSAKVTVPVGAVKLRVEQPVPVVRQVCSAVAFVLGATNALSSSWVP